MIFPREAGAENNENAIGLPKSTMTIEIETMTVARLHAQLQALMDDGKGYLPVCATDCVVRFPFQAYTVLTPSGYTDSLLLYVRPDARFKRPDPVPMHWTDSRANEWNGQLDEVQAMRSNQQLSQAVASQNG